MGATRIEVATRPEHPDPRGRQVEHDVRAFLGLSLAAVRTSDVYLIDARLSGAEALSVLGELVDPVLQHGAIGRLEHGEFDVAVSVGYKPGVTDPVGKSALVLVRDTLRRELEPDAAVFTSRVYLLHGVERAAAERIAVELLANPVIQRIAVRTREEWRAAPPDTDPPRVAEHATPRVRTIELTGDDEALLRISREKLLALDLAEMRAIARAFERFGEDPRRRELGLGGFPTDVELECLAQTWSEHCKHKIFNATIDYHEPGRAAETIRSLFREYIRGSTEAIDDGLRARGEPSWLVSVFHDNAGAVAFDERRHLVYKVETHNSPSALDPYGGAITGIVGVNRDPFGTGLGADLLVNVWGYCFAPPAYDGALPAGLLHPRRVRDGVHQGVIDGGNQSGIPYGRGFELFDARFVGKPLVFCGTVGALPVTVAGRPGESKSARPGDLIVMTGGRIGADGIHGATFSSTALDEQAPVQAVQIGDPITQKVMFDFLLEARDRGLYSAITDNGAGGLSSSVGEMARGPGGARIDLARAPLKYAGLAPWEIFLSEAQERMTLAVPRGSIDAFVELARRREVEATVLGEFIADPLLHVRYGGETVAWLPMDFLHDGAPEMRLVARWEPPALDEPPRELAQAACAGAGATLLALLRRLNVASNEKRARRYDHEVKGLTVVPPWVGVARDVPAEATVFLGGHDTRRGFVLAEGINPFFSDIDTHAMAQAVVDLAVRRLLCGGAGLERMALLDNFCWPDPVQSEATPDGELKLAWLVRACRGLAEATRAYGAPLISGKDSMKNDSRRGGVTISVPPTLLVSGIGQIADVRRALTLEPRQAGELVYLIGPTGDETGGSEYFRHLGELAGKSVPLGRPRPYVGSKVPRVDLGSSRARYEVFAEAVAAGLVRAAAAPALGGWGLAFARVAMAGRVGLELDLDAAGLTGLSTDVALFSESCGRLLVTVAPDDAGRLEALFATVGECRRAGRVTDEPRLRIRHAGAWVVDLAVTALVEAYQETFGDD